MPKVPRPLYLILILSWSAGCVGGRTDLGVEDGGPPCSDVFDLPVIVVDTHERAIPDEPKIPAEMRVFAHGIGALSALDSDTPNMESRLGIERRGHSSQVFPKPQYGVELRDSSGGTASVSLLGMPPATEWVFGAPYMDKSLIRNHLAYELSRSIGLYAPRTAFMELFLADDGATHIGLEHYRGVYVLTEKIEQGPHRVNIERLARSDESEPEISGGYLLEWTYAERLEDSDRWFRTPRGAVLRIANPKPQDLTTAQQDWITDYVVAVEGALGESSDRYAALIDTESFVNYFLLNEFLRNSDVFFDSTFMHKNREGPLCMGPPWDFDRALGDVGLSEESEVEGFLLPTRGWGRRLLANPDFLRRYRERWKVLRQGELATEAIVARIDSAVATLGAAAGRNFAQWQVLGKYVPVNHPPYSKTFEEEVTKVKSWLAARADWLDAHMDQL